ncbi:MAG: response regulator transcription factor [Synechococcales cyanobacterium T60_A2020_003]|nr:response regulator transcription factor [Synechococcales cyanobacterium T60_A2020_003]
MFSIAPNQIRRFSVNAPVRSPRQDRQPPSLPQRESLDFLATVMEGLMDGILIVTTQGKVVQMNVRARDICRQLQGLRGQDQHKVAPINALPAEVWRVCEALIESRDLWDDAIAPESELRIEGDKVYRVRVHWLRFQVDEQSCILVTLEDRLQALESMAIADAQKYGLTEREAEVWRLRLLGRSYQQIATELYIAENTVKKHIKSIFSKRRSILGDLDPTV